MSQKYFLKSKWDDVRHVDCGLQNYGASSHINASLQVLLHTPPFLRWLDSFEMHERDCKIQRCAICSLLLVRRYSVQHQVPDNLLQDLFILFDGEFVPDVSDMFLHIVSQLHHHYLAQLGVNESTSEVSPILDIFGGSLATSSTCLHCKDANVTFISSLCLQLTISNPVSIQDASKQNLQELQKVKMWCSRCNKEAPHEKSSVFSSEPFALCIRLLRLPNKAGEKLHNVEISQNLDSPSGVKYNFVGAILKNGNKGRGHFAALVKCPDYTLLLINDSEVRKVSYGALTKPEYQQKVYLALYCQEGRQNSPLKLAQAKRPKQEANLRGPSSPHKVKRSATSKSPAQATTNTWTVTPNKLERMEDETQKSKSVTNVAHDGSSRMGVLKPRRLNMDCKEIQQKDLDGNVIVNNSNSDDIVKDDNPPPAVFRRQKGCKHDCCQYVTKTVYIRSIASYEVCNDTLSDKHFQFYCGLSKYNFEVLFELLGGEEVISKLKYRYDMHTPKKKMVCKLSPKNRLFLMLIRLRRGVPVRDLALVFNISPSLISLIFFAMIRLTYLTFKSLEGNVFLSRHKQLKNRPDPFKPFPTVRVIIDGAEFRIQRPSNFEQQGNTYSNYKSTNTVRFVIGISCYGGIIFVSEGYEGNIEESDIICRCGIIDKLERGDGLMCDRGFDISSELMKRGVELFKPPVLGERDRLTPSEELLTSAIASARIYVEHAVWEIKQNRLLRFVIPLTLQPILPDMVYVAAFLANFKSKNIKRQTKKTKK